MPGPFRGITFKPHSKHWNVRAIPILEENIRHRDSHFSKDTWKERRKEEIQRPQHTPEPK